MWTIAIMGTSTLLLISIAMMLSLTQFQETPSGDWVKISEQISSEFKAKSVAVRINFAMAPGFMKSTTWRRRTPRWNASPASPSRTTRART